jgi:GT2 family glycosyltransferase
MDKELSNITIDILIIFFNKVDQTINCINSFLPSGQLIYIFNNGSDQNQADKLNEYFDGDSRVKIINSTVNLGPAGGRNYLIKNSKNKWLFFVDNDITIKPDLDWLMEFRLFLSRNPTVEIICPKIYNIHESAYMDRIDLILVGSKLELTSVEAIITNYFPEGGAIVSRAVFDRNGLYDLKMFAFEGYEFALRALKSINGGLKVHHIKNIELIHDHRYQKKSSDRDAVRTRYNARWHIESYKHLCEKHDVSFDHDWNWWVNKQLHDMTASPFKLKIKKLIFALKGLLKR